MDAFVVSTAVALLGRRWGSGTAAAHSHGCPAVPRAYQRVRVPGGRGPGAAPGELRQCAGRPPRALSLARLSGLIAQHRLWCHAGRAPQCLQNLKGQLSP